MGSLASPQILVSVQERAEYRFGMRSPQEGHAQRWLIGLCSMTGGFKILLRRSKSYTHPCILQEFVLS